MQGWPGSLELAPGTAWYNAVMSGIGHVGKFLRFVNGGKRGGEGACESLHEGIDGVGLLKRMEMS